jgi:hypothetical protein
MRLNTEKRSPKGSGLPLTIEYRAAAAQEPQHLDVAHDLLHIIVVNITVAAMDLHGIECDLQGGVGAEDRGCHRDGVSAVRHPRAQTPPTYGSSIHDDLGMHVPKQAMK